MPVSAQYWMGLLMLCVAAVFTVGLGSLLQHRAINRHQAATVAYSEAFAVSVLPPVYRKASF
jgi:drug/metabolite transporter (DMT)-like permease